MEERNKKRTSFQVFYLLHSFDIVLRFELSAQFNSIEPERHTKKKKYICEALKKLEVVRVYQLVFVHFSVFYVQTKENMLKRELNKAIFAIFSIVVWASMYAYNVQDSKVFKLCIFIGNKCVCVYTYVIGVFFFFRCSPVDSDVHMKNWYEIK